MKELTLHQAAKLTRCPPSQIRLAIRRGWINGVQVNDDVPPDFIVFWDAKYTEETLIALGMRARERDRRRKRRRQGAQR